MRTTEKLLFLFKKKKEIQPSEMSLVTVAEPVRCQPPTYPKGMTSAGIAEQEFHGFFVFLGLQ